VPALTKSTVVKMGQSKVVKKRLANKVAARDPVPPVDWDELHDDDDDDVEEK
jgi:hypothetical protein